MTRIKICGITNLDDALWAVECGADALGFIGVKESPRFISSTEVERIVSRLPAFVTTVSVVRLAADAVSYPCDRIQYYAGDPLDKRRCYKAVRVKDLNDLEELARLPLNASSVLLDKLHDTLLGGSGESFDWSLAVAAKRFTTLPIILAGGLTPENVAEAIALVHPYGVDVASGTEASPGRKDHAKVAAFIRSVREFDQAGVVAGTQ